MASLNGAPGKPAPSKGGNQREHYKPIVPVLPLNYPQWPVARIISSKMAKSHGPLQEMAEASTLAKQAAVAEAVHTNGQSQVHTAAASSKILTQTPFDGSPSVSNSGPDHTVETPVAAFISTAIVLPTASPTPTRRPAQPDTSPANKSNGLETTASVTEPSASVDSKVIMTPTHTHEHYSHPSHNSLGFGLLKDSNASSPNPRSRNEFPLSGGMPFHGAAVPLDLFGRPMMMSPLVDGFAPPKANHGPPTPHSLHGSQASTHTEGSGSGRYFPTAVHEVFARNGIPPPLPPLSAVHAPLSGGFGPPGFPTSPNCSVNHKIREEAMDFLRNAFEDRESSDCLLELRIIPSSVDGQTVSERPAALRLDLHRFVLNRSPTLRQKLRDCPPSQASLVLEVHDQHMRPDAFYYTLRTLYGGDLGDYQILPTPTPPRDIREDFDLTLGYVSAAQYLQLPLVHAHLLGRALGLVSWETVAKACLFVSNNGLYSRQIGQDAAPGDQRMDTSMFAKHVVDFIVQSIPLDFVLDLQAAPGQLSRLPAYQSPSKPQQPLDFRRSHESTNWQSHTHSSHARMSHRLSEIKFGDVSSTTANGDALSHSRQDPSMQRSPSPFDTTVSGILFDLPFDQLKKVLEYPRWGRGGTDMNPALRMHITMEMVAERERRRLYCLQNTSEPALHALQDRLRASREPVPVTGPGDVFLNNMGFREEFLSDQESPNAPYLSRKWEGLPLDANGVA